MDLMISRLVPPGVWPYIYGGRIIASRKSTGRLRPIAVGCRLCQLCAKTVSSRVHGELGKKFRPIQLGYGTPGGAQAGVHAVREYLDQHLPDEKTAGKIVMKLNFASAFKQLHRQKALLAVSKLLPEYYGHACKITATILTCYFRDSVVEFQRGVQQGDPLRPAILALTSFHLAEKMSLELNHWYLHECTLKGDFETVVSDIRVIAGASEEFGLLLNFLKYEVMAAPYQEGEEL